MSGVGKSRGRRAEFGAVTRLPSGRFRARYTLPDGSRRAGPTTFATAKDARRFLTRVQAELITGNTLAAQPTTTPVGDYVRSYLDDAAATLRPRTLDLYRRTAASWLLSPVGITTRVDIAAVPLHALSPSVVRSWYSALLEHTHHAATTAPASSARRGGHPARVWAKRHGWDLAKSGRIPADVLAAWTAAGSPDPTTDNERQADTSTAGRTAAAGAYRLLRTIVSQAVTDGLIPSNPVHIKGASTAPHRERRPLAPADIAALADAVPDRYRAAVIVAAWSGLRPGEVFALRRCDIDLDGHAVTVARTLVEIPGQSLSFGPPKSAAGLRTVNLPSSVTEVLAEHLAEFTGTTAQALVFTTAYGNPVSGSARSTVMGKARLVIDRPDITWHHLRHTGATLAAQAGATGAELQARIGHSTARAAAIYQHAADGRDKSLAERMNAMMHRPDPTPPESPNDPTPPTDPTASAPAEASAETAAGESASGATTIRRGHLRLITA